MEFSALATNAAKRIISELFTEERSIPAITSQVGGVAGMIT
jgi:hypothetical protein